MIGQERNLKETFQRIYKRLTCIIDGFPHTVPSHRSQARISESGIVPQSFNFSCINFLVNNLVAIVVKGRGGGKKNEWRILIFFLTRKDDQKL